MVTPCQFFNVFEKKWSIIINPLPDMLYIWTMASRLYTAQSFSTPTFQLKCDLKVRKTLGIWNNIGNW